GRVLGGPDGHVAALVDLHARPAVAAVGAVVRDEEGRLDRPDEHVERDLLVLRQALQKLHIDVHGYASSSFLSLRLNSISTRALAISSKARRRAVGLRPLTPGTSRSSPSSSTVRMRATSSPDPSPARWNLASRPMART